MMKTRFAALLPLLALFAGPAAAADPAPTVDDARRFIEGAEARLLDLAITAQRAAWIQNTHITEDTEAMAAHHNEQYMAAQAELAKEAARFQAVPGLPFDVARKIQLLKTSITLAPPRDPAASRELARLGSAMESAYGKGKWCPPVKTGEEGEDGCLDIGEMTRLLRTRRDPKLLLDVWKNWHAVGAPLRKDYQRFVAIANEGARELGFADTGEMWRSRYDVPPREIEPGLDALWQQLRPLYVSLHAYMRKRLRETYGPEVVPEKGPIPAHLLGNMWAQEWDALFPLVAPKDEGPGYDLTALLKAKKVTPIDMVKRGEAFFTSLGFPALPKTFWERSMFVKPRDREVVCHASAWDIDFVDDLRIKMCIEVNDEDFGTIHHELGHNFYYMAYKEQPFLFRDGANDGFHEAAGDTVLLSVTPDYLVKTGILAKAPPASKDVGLLLNMALQKVAFLPFGLTIDQWRWKVFSGEVPPEKYNQAWWDLKLKYQGVAPPLPRTEADFDPGAKYHVPANVPYMRYFLADVLQFQFHRALCKAAGYEGPLNRCSIYENSEAGLRLRKTLAMGSSRPWMEALEALTNESALEASAMLEYFAPLQKWLDEQNKGVPVGW
jgi:peptidyl-dipeptidase A